ncbi:DUF1795 domain-containing protein [Candidatus Gracilibacteria bacterium]|nr:DUF1795 domain-containing protein [Candidatus Gracilibacteria bacterium]
MKKLTYLILISSLTLSLFGCTSKTLEIQETISTNPDIKLQENNNKDNNVENKTVINNEIIKTEDTYQNKLFGFKLKLPDGRTFEENNKIEKKMGMLVNFFPQQNNLEINENLSISIDQLQTDEEVQEYYQQQQNLTKDYINNFQEISSEKLKINKISGIKSVFKGELGGNLLQRQQILLKKNGIFFLITYTSTQELFNQNIDQIDQIIESFQF